MPDVASVSLLLFLVFLLAKALGEVAERLRVPALVGEILAGLLVANFVWGPFHLEAFIGLDPTSAQGMVNRDVLSGLSEIGLIFLIFTAGLEIRSSDLRRVGRRATSVALFGMVVPFVLGFAYVAAFPQTDSLFEAVFVGAALVATSIGITARVLRDRGTLSTELGRTIIGAAVIDDLGGITILAVLLGVATQGVSSPASLLYQALIVGAIEGVFVVFFLFLAPGLVRRFAHPESPTSVLARMRTHNAPYILALLVCLGASALAASFQLAAIVGAFFAGMALAEVREQYGLVEMFESLNAFLVPFFFFEIGLEVSVGALGSVWVLAIVLTLLAVVGKVIGAGAAARGLGRRSALAVGFAMVPRGEVGIVIAVAAFSVGAIGDGIYSAVVLMSLATSVIAPPVLDRLLLKGKTPERRPVRSAARSDRPSS